MNRQRCVYMAQTASLNPKQTIMHESVRKDVPNVTGKCLEFMKDIPPNPLQTLTLWMEHHHLLAKLNWEVLKSENMKERKKIQCKWETPYFWCVFWASRKLYNGVGQCYRLQSGTTFSLFLVLNRVVHWCRLFLGIYTILLMSCIWLFFYI